MSNTNKDQQHQQLHYHSHEGATFDHNQPRPATLGEEKSHFVSDWGQQTERHKQVSPLPGKHYGFSKDPASIGHEFLPPQPLSAAIDSSYCPRSSSSRPSSCHDRNGGGGDNPTSSPSCLRWARSLHVLLQDSDGVRLFQQYLESEGKQHADTLDFWFACEGLRKQQGKEKIHQLVKVIYKKFFVKSALPISEELRKEIGKVIKSSQCLEPPVTLFDDAQAQVESLIVKTTYPNFLKSDMYLQYLENAQNSSSSGSTFSQDLSNLASGPDPLPTLHEDMELIMKHPVHINHTSGSVSTGYHTPNIGGPVRLTKDVLLMSQNRRAVDVRPKSETFASMFVYRGGHGVHAAYNSYNPVSRQDSELHSLSSHSDARESDNMSLTDSSVDGRSMGRTSRRQAALNRETHMNQIFIPRTQRMEKTQCQPMNEETFAAILTEKLEIVKKDRDLQELLERRLNDNESMSSTSDAQAKDLKNAMREKLQLEDENYQAILDDHISMVFPDTPGRSPGIASPMRNRHIPGSRRRKDGSTFSSDSGNVNDFAEGSEHKLGMVKSKSMPEYPEERFSRGAVGRRSSSKKTLADLTDSGVSVVSDTPPVNVPVKDPRVLAWVMENDRSGRSASHTHSEMSVKHRSYRTSSATSPIASRHRKGFGSRSSSVERNSASSATLVPAQPFVADPSMPPLPSPDTAMQLEECRRRLMEDDVRARSRQRSSSNRHYPSELAQSSQSTLRKSQRGASRPTLPPQPPSDELTTVVFSFCDEQFPYRTKIPGSQITLRQFKEYLPKKGNYRFFFKTICEDLGNQVIQEEISNDGDILPLWEGKIMAQVKPID